MKNARLESLIEELSSEPRSPDYDSVFSSMQRIDSKAHELAKGYGVSVEAIYKAMDFDPRAYITTGTDDPDSLDFSHSDVMRDLYLLEKQLVPEDDRKYGGVGKMLENDEAIFNLFGERPLPEGGEPVKRKEITLDEEKGYVDKFLLWAGKHPVLTAGGLLAIFFGGGAALGQLYKSKDSEKTAAIPAAAIITADSPQPPLSATPTVNESAVKEHQFSPDIEFHGSEVYKQKMQKALEEIKRVDPKEYDEVMLYLEVVRSGSDDTVGKGVVTIPEEALDFHGPAVLVHEKRHVLQGLSPLKSQFEGKSGWYDELDAVEAQVEFDAKLHNRVGGDEWKRNRIKNIIKLYKDAYPNEYAQFISEN